MMKFWKGAAGALSTVLSWLVFLLGGWDAALGAMFLFMALDYLTGLLSAFAGKSPKTAGGRFSSGAAFIGLSKKLMMMLVIILAAALDRFTGDSGVCRSAAIGFYVVNEGLSIVENAAALGVPLPRALKNMLESMQEKQPEADKAEDLDE